MSTASSSTPTPSQPDITPSQRAAVVIAMLGEEAAKPIVDRLDDVAIATMAASLETITYLTREQLVEIVIDFLRHLRQSTGSLRGGPDEARKFLEGVLDAPRLNILYGDGEPTLEEQVPEPVKTEDFSRIWNEMAKREPAQIAKYLNGLTPNIIALIMRNLDTTLCSQLLCLLDEATQTGVLGEMVDPPPPSPEIDAVIARMVRMEFLLVPEKEEEDDNSQLLSVGEMLSLVPGERRAPLMSYLNKSHSTKVEPIQKGMFEIADIPLLLNRNQVPILFKTMDQGFILTVLAFMQDQHPKVAEYFLNNISNRMAEQIRDDLGQVKAPGPEEAEEVERQFLTEMMDLKRREIIQINDRSTLEEDAG